MSAKRAMPGLTPFLAAVRRTILAIPRGQTMSYGTVAELSGVPNGARAVVRALHALDDIPWWRVCRAGGTFAHQTMPLQEDLLRQEGWLPEKRAAGSGPRAAGTTKQRAGTTPPPKSRKPVARSPKPAAKKPAARSPR